MAEKTNLGSMKRFGTRYGPKNKEKVAAIENEHRGKHKCPFCNYVKVRRLSSRGIWQCGTCNAKFAGKAYGFETSKKAIMARVEEEPIEEVEEEFTDEPEQEAA
ncbi:MAG: 50S ribosomal protein L37ae [Candidatus Woesearchaeota archaeon]